MFQIHEGLRIENDSIENVSRTVVKKYKKNFGKGQKDYITQISNGTEIINEN